MLCRFLNKIPLSICLAGMMTFFCPEGSASDLSFSSEKELEEDLHNAELFFEASQFDMAIPIYQKWIEAIVDNEKRQTITFLLAKAFFLNEEYSSVIHLLTQEPASFLNEFEQKPLILLGASYRHEGKFKKAISILESYDTKNGMGSEKAYLELGIAHFLLDDLNAAKKYLKKINGKEKDPQTYILSNLYLARIYMKEGDVSRAETILDSLHDLSKNSNLLNFEIAYLKGEILFKSHNYFKAAEYFEKALPAKNPERVTWYKEALFHLGWSYFKAADDHYDDLNKQLIAFNKAEEYFKKLITVSTDENAHLALAQCYLTRGRRLHDMTAYKEAEEVLNHQEAFATLDAKNHALLLKAQAGQTYSLRANLYRQLTDEANKESSFCAKGWYWQGLNDFEEGLFLLNNGSADQANRLFEQAVISFKHAFNFLKSSDPSLAGQSLKYQAEAYSFQNQENSLHNALMVLETLLNEYRESILNLMEEPGEIYYLHGLFASHLSLREDGEKFAEAAQDSLKKGVLQFPKSKFTAQALYLLATLHYREEKYFEAEKIFQNILENYPQFSLRGEALFWKANCLEFMKSHAEEVKTIREEVYKKYPHSKHSDEAYFLIYPYGDYLQGDRTAVKHLESFCQLFPNSPFLLNAYYLIGLDHKRDRKTPEGKWIRKKNLIAAIDAFQSVESTFDSLMKENLIPSDKIGDLLKIRYRAILERAMANLAIAEESEGTKHQIYLEYAEEVFRHIKHDFENPGQSMTNFIFEKEAYPSIEEENAFWLSQTYIKKRHDGEAKKILSEMLEKYRSLKITKGYFLSLVWYHLALIEMRAKNFNNALDFLIQAEDASKGRVLSSDQKLDIWIQQSLCYQSLKDPEKAILILSKVINDDAVSGLRIKAMLLRAEIYEMQKRYDLARKQLEAASKKGGEWGLKAKLKLEKEYGSP